MYTVLGAVVISIGKRAREEGGGGGGGGFRLIGSHDVSTCEQAGAHLVQWYSTVIGLYVCKQLTQG